MTLSTNGFNLAKNLALITTVTTIKLYLTMKSYYMFAKKYFQDHKKILPIVKPVNTKKLGILSEAGRVN